MKELRINEIKAAYRKKLVLRGISFSVQPGTITALIGPNGSGKSTLLKVIAGFLRPLSGKIWVDDREISALPSHTRVGLGLSYFMQGGKVFPSLTAWENLEMSSATVRISDRKKKILSSIEIFPNLEGVLQKRAGLLSGGERQYLALAMAFARGPEILLLDEPSVGLSPRLAQELLKKILEVSRAERISVLIVEQNLRGVLEIAQNGLALLDGKISLETENPRAWLTDARVHELFWNRKEA